MAANQAATWTPTLTIELILAIATVIGMAIGLITLMLGSSRFLLLNEENTTNS
jgi:hypothetical protein